MNGATPVGSHLLALHPPKLILVGNGDYNGDGLADAVWLDERAEELLVELTDPAGPSDGTPLAASVLLLPDHYMFAGSTDFDGDGRADLVVFDEDENEMTVWLMDGISIDRVLLLGDPRRYSPFALGDFDGDSLIEIFTKRTRISPRQRRLEFDGSAAVSTDSYAAPVDKAWVPVGVGDHDGDGVDDVLWLDRDTGILEIWSIKEGADLVRVALDVELPSGAEVTGSGDYDGDGRVEIAVREESPGGVSIWYTDGTRVIDIVPVMDLGPSWGLVGVGAETPTL
jgi:hypothetical protein